MRFRKWKSGGTDFIPDIYKACGKLTDFETEVGVELCAWCMIGPVNCVYSKDAHKQLSWMWGDGIKNYTCTVILKYSFSNISF